MQLTDETGQCRSSADRRDSHGFADPLAATCTSAELISRLKNIEADVGISDIDEEPGGRNAELAAVPIVSPEASTMIGLIYPKRDPMPALTVALVNEARQLVPVLTAMS